MAWATPSKTDACGSNRHRRPNGEPHEAQRPYGEAPRLHRQRRHSASMMPAGAGQATALRNIRYERCPTHSPTVAFNWPSATAGIIKSSLVSWRDGRRTPKQGLIFVRKTGSVAGLPRPVGLPMPAGSKRNARQQAIATFTGSPGRQPSELVKYHAVGRIDNRIVERGKVKACGVLGVMPHPLADHAQRYVLAVGRAGPRMAGFVQCRYICGNRCN